MPGPRRLRLSNVILSNARFTKTGWDLKPHIWNTLVSECELNLLDKQIVSLTVYVGLCVCVCVCSYRWDCKGCSLHQDESHNTAVLLIFSFPRKRETEKPAQTEFSSCGWGPLHHGVTSSRHSIFVFRPLTSFCVFTQFSRHIPCKSEITDVILDNSEWFMWALWCSAKHQHST